MALINLRNALMAGKRLPYDAEVEYLESSSTQWIDTGYSFNSATDKVELVFELLTTTQRYKWIFGAYDTQKRLAIGSGDMQNRRTLGYNKSTSYNSDAYYTDGAHIFLADSTGASIDGHNFFGFADFSTTSHIILYTIPIDSSTYCANVRIWSYKHYRNGVLVRDYIPVRKGTVGYLYDRVTGQLFGNAGTGDFVLGQDVVHVEYIESHGTEWINTGINIDTGTDTVQGDVLFLPDTASGYKYYFGTYGTPTGESALTYYALAKITNTTGIIAYIPSTASNGYSILSMGSVDESWHTIQMGPSGLYFDGVDKTGGIVQRTVAFGAPFALFAGIYANDGRPRSHCRARLRHFQISRNNTLVRSFLPIRVGTDATSWEGAMMDTLTRRIYRNQGTGAFGYGGDLPLETLAN